MAQPLLIKNYYRTKERFERSRVLIFQLTGIFALKERIKKSVRHYLKVKIYYLLEEIQTTTFNRQVDHNEWKNITGEAQCGMSIDDP